MMWNQMLHYRPEQMHDYLLVQGRLDIGGIIYEPLQIIDDYNDVMMMMIGEVIFINDNVKRIGLC